MNDRCLQAIQVRRTRALLIGSLFLFHSGEAGGSKLSNVLKAKEDMQKSPEQLEKEKREIISSRLLRLDLNGKTKDDLVKQVSPGIDCSINTGWTKCVPNWLICSIWQAEEFYQALISLHSQIYDLTEKHDRQRYDASSLFYVAKGPIVSVHAG